MFSLFHWYGDTLCIIAYWYWLIFSHCWALVYGRYI
nr:MAG TPA: hypothetical protein [Caudoviricetes sp.]